MVSWWECGQISLAYEKTKLKATCKEKDETVNISPYLWLKNRMEDTGDFTDLDFESQHYHTIPIRTVAGGRRIRT